MTSRKQQPPGETGGMSRRHFNMLLSGAIAGGVIMPRLVTEAVAQPTTYNEAPMLAEKVAAGTLPPVTERLPLEPVVVEPTNAIGTYGGRLMGASMAPEVTSDLQIGQNTGLFRFSNDLKELYPEVATGYEFSPDFMSCTITIRKGLKWSDGHPMTVDDIIFFVEDWQYNADLFPNTPGSWLVGGKKLTLEKIDDVTIKFNFPQPNPAFQLIHYSGPPAEPWRASHYLKPFHLKYNPNVEAEAVAAGYKSWQARFAYVAGTINYQYGAMNPDLPVLGPWVQVSNNSERQQYERNPYYLKVDSAGNQLPYVDYMTVDYAGSPEVMNLKAVSGELSVAGLDIQLINYPIIRESAETGGYAIKLVYSERGADVAIAFNQAHPDPVLAPIFADVRFRQAMSLGINREEINELVFLGQGTIRQATINESASFFKQEWADSFAQFDLDKANALLDELGLDKRGGDGTRLRPDGKLMTFQLEYLPQEGPKKETCELVVKHWLALGIRVDAIARERAYLQQRLTNQEQDASAWHVDRVLERPAYAYSITGKLAPGGGSMIQYGRVWQNWFNSAGEQGVEPSQDAKDLYDAYVAWSKTEMGTPAYVEAANRVHDLIAQSLYVIGVIGQAPQPVMVRNDVENVFKTGDETKLWWGAANWFWHTSKPEQWFIKA